MRVCVEMQVSGVVLDPTSQHPIVILRDKEGRHILPIWVGVMEAGAIAAVLEELTLPRPITHDLFISSLAEFGVKVLQLEITRLEEGTFFGELTLSNGQVVRHLDCRPSDGIALALRAGAPIYAAEEVIQRAGILVEGPSDSEGTDPSLEELLASLPDEVFGKYKM